MAKPKVAAAQKQRAASAPLMRTAEEIELWKAERRAAREAKRAKQRAENVGRAEAMRAERLAHPVALGSKSKLGRRTALPLNVGCSGWFYWHWKRCFYPADLSTKDWFDYYAARFKTVELNAPFYSWPTAATVRTWLKQAGRRNFVYTVKVCELITHVKRFDGTKTLVRDFGYIADILGPRFGCFLFQLPPSFHYTPGRLRSIIGQLEPHRRNVVEFRHASWWNDEVYAAFKAAGIIFCSCSGPRLPDVLVKTAPDVYVRFHGTTRWYRHNYSRYELELWAERIAAAGAERSWIYFNNDNDCYAIGNARTLQRLLKRQLSP
ncbi:DUF72 domain-containing protein [Terricaulis sp.]|uniref:DUF72 domain-containing protein n=1 Tax=Terricaulis sp. TaxID=2768686 RepID=UPI002AC76371|nr:DUF72 domain-containing protein [Terricaulis sp.]MDZ4690942.1 DUF72 domain-containing protein [Terricaulis sp.]